MSINPKQRLDFFLAKAAGESVDITTLTPPSPTNELEKSLLKISERLDNLSQGSTGSEESSGSSSSGQLSLVVDVYYVIGNKSNTTVSRIGFDDVLAAVKSGVNIRAAIYCINSGTDTTSAEALEIAETAKENDEADLVGVFAYSFAFGNMILFAPFGLNGTGNDFEYSVTVSPSGEAYDLWTISDALLSIFLNQS